MPTPIKPWILLVEDEPEIVEVVTEALTEEGFRVTSCSKAAQALRLMNNQKYDCLLLDNQLEQGTGEQVLAAVRKEKTNLNYATPALMVSGQLDQGTLIRIGKELVGALVKPFEMKALVAKLKSICEDSTGAAFIS